MVFLFERRFVHQGRLRPDLAQSVSVSLDVRHRRLCFDHLDEFLAPVAIGDGPDQAMHLQHVLGANGALQKSVGNAADVGP